MKAYPSVPNIDKRIIFGSLPRQGGVKKLELALRLKRDMQFILKDERYYLTPLYPLVSASENGDEAT